MKNILTLLISFTFLFSFSQSDEVVNIQYQFIKVADQDREEYEAFMLEFVSKIAEKAVEEGKITNLVLRRVNQGSMFSSNFNYMIITAGQKNSPNWSEIMTKAYPNISPELRSWIWSKGNALRDIIYNAYTTRVEGFDRTPGTVSNIVVYNLIKANSSKKNDYVEFEKENAKNIEKYADTMEGWYCVTRNGQFANGAAAWDVLTADTFKTMKDVNTVWWTKIPQKEREKLTKKYGSLDGLRTIRHRIIAPLIYDAINGKSQN